MKLITTPQLPSGGVKFISITRDRDKFAVHPIDMQGRPIDVRVTSEVLTTPKRFAMAMLNQAGFYAPAVEDCRASTWRRIVANAVGGMDTGAVL